MAMIEYTVKFSIDDSWIADGFDMTDDRALKMLASDLDFACMDTELKAEVIAYPAAKEIAQLQGYHGKFLEKGIAFVEKTRQNGKL